MQRALVCAALWSLACAACAAPEDDVTQAINTCLAAVIDGRPVSDLTHGATTIKFTQNPTDCTIRAMDGQPDVLRERVLTAARARPEGFAPAKTQWDPARYGRRESLCAPPGGRNLFVLISTAEPDAKGTRLMATVMESSRPDPRCYVDKGMQEALINGPRP